MRNSYDNDKFSTNCTFTESMTFNFNPKKLGNNVKFQVENKLFLKEIDDEISCCICMNYLNNPYICSSCEVAFCHSCIGKWMLYNDECPQKCSSKSFEPRKSIILRKLMDKVIVICKCGYRSSLLDLNDHQCSEKSPYKREWDDISNDLRNSLDTPSLNVKEVKVTENEEQENPFMKKENYNSLLKNFSKVLEDVEEYKKLKEMEISTLKSKNEDLEEKYVDSKLKKEFAEWRLSNEGTLNSKPFIGKESKVVKKSIVLPSSKYDQEVEIIMNGRMIQGVLGSAAAKDKDCKGKTEVFSRAFIKNEKKEQADQFANTLPTQNHLSQFNQSVMKPANVPRQSHTRFLSQFKDKK